RDFWQNTWAGRSLFFAGARDPVLGVPVMQRLQHTVRGAPALVVLPQAGHFVQEHGASIAQQALEYFRL
ncbi:MAG TPA: tRNA adenosine(34) deaminase TadA, partial [Giesbergeria sp.]|nr:tRNA adenosine(34) deaminase TadA [Giesbergeria sp.]